MKMNYELELGYHHDISSNEHKFAFTFPVNTMKQLYLVGSWDDWKTPIPFTNIINPHNNKWYIWELCTQKECDCEYKFMYETVETGVKKWFNEVHYSNKHGIDLFYFTDNSMINNKMIKNKCHTPMKIKLTKEVNNQFDNKVCICCKDKPVEYIYTSCGHYCICTTCVGVLAQQQGAYKCPVCRYKSSVIRVILP